MATNDRALPGSCRASCVWLCLVFLICAWLLAATAVPCAAQANVKIYVNTSAIDGRADLTAAEKAALKSAIKAEIKRNLETAFGAGQVDVSDDPAQKGSADRTVNIRNEEGHYTDNNGNNKRKWGVWTGGSSQVRVYLKNYMDLAASEFKSGDPPVWDTTRLGTAIGSTACHEVAHSFSAGHDNSDPSSKMGRSHRAAQLGDGLNLLEPAQDVLRANRGKPPCKTATDYSTECCMPDWWSDTQPPEGSEMHEGPTLTAQLTCGGSLASMFDLGWWGADTDKGAIDGNANGDFIYKSSMTGTVHDSPTIAFFEGWTAHFVLRGRPGTPYANTYFDLKPGYWYLTDMVVRPDGRKTYRQVVSTWDVDGIPGIDVTASLDAAPYGPLNGFVRGIAPRLSVSQAKTCVNGAYVALRDLVATRVFQDHFYVQSIDRSAGIRVRWAEGGVPPVITEGTGLLLEGKMATESTGERLLIAVPAKTQIGSAISVRPLGMPGRCIGGGDYEYAPGIWPSGQRGVIGSSGANNIGLLVKTWAKVAKVEPVTPPAHPSWMAIEDANGRRIMCSASGEAVISADWQGKHVSVTGISGCAAAGDETLESRIYVNQFADIKLY